MSAATRGAAISAQGESRISRSLSSDGAMRRSGGSSGLQARLLLPQALAQSRIDRNRHPHSSHHWVVARIEPAPRVGEAVAAAEAGAWAVGQSVAATNGQPPMRWPLDDLDAVHRAVRAAQADIA